MAVDEAIHSQAWYRVEALRPRVRNHARIHRHQYRDDVWYVLEDTASGRCHRFSDDAYAIIGLMDGERTVAEIWDAVVERLGEGAPTQDELIRLLGELHAADVLQSDLDPDSEEISDRRRRQRGRKRIQKAAQPLAIRVPLIDPDAFLRRTLPWVSPFISLPGLALWALVVVTGGYLALANWGELTDNPVDRVLSASNLLVLWLAYPLVKAIHELGHAYCARKWGAPVHEIGVMFLVLFPVPYVEASAATAFRDKHQRMVVGAAGIMVELLLAALAAIVWVNAEPGFVRTLAFNVMLIGGVSTLLFNGNPLLRFDGYYVLCDWIEIPNLGTRSTKYLQYLMQRYLFGMRDVQSPAQARGERAWFVCYGVAATVYRLFIMLAIALFVASQFFVVGVLLAIWALLQQAVWPVLKGLRFLVTSSRLDRSRTRAVLVSTVFAAAVLALTVFTPMPSWTATQGVVWLPEQFQVRAAESGTVARLLATPGAQVAPGEALVESEDDVLLRQVELYEAKLTELDARLARAQVAARTEAQVVREEIRIVEADLARARQRLDALVLRAESHGELVVVDAPDLPGRFVRRGEVVAYVVDPSQAVVRAVVDQDDIGLVRGGTATVHVWLEAIGSEPVATEILRIVPSASRSLPSPALGTFGGGRIAADPADGSGLSALQDVFVVDLALPDEALARFVGQRVAVRFGHDDEALAQQWYRGLRQLFLARFGV